MEILSDTLHNAGNHEVSIGKTITEVAVFSKHTGHFVEFKNIRKGSKLAKVKRKFKSFLNSGETLTFSHMQPETTKELINLLKK